jgi:hypothetical protein
MPSLSRRHHASVWFEVSAPEPDGQVPWLPHEPGVASQICPLYRRLFDGLVRLFDGYRDSSGAYRFGVCRGLFGDSSFPSLNRPADYRYLSANCVRFAHSPACRCRESACPFDLFPQVDNPPPLVETLVPRPARTARDFRPG